MREPVRSVRHERGPLQLTVANPALIGTFKAGDKYYLDFTKAEK